MKKTVQVAFGISLLVLSVIGTVWPSETIGSIIYAIILPSFIFSIISFVSEISEACGEIAHSTFEKAYKTASQSHDKVQKDMEAYEAGEYKTPYSPDIVPNEIYNELVKSTELMKVSAITQEMKAIFDKYKKRCDKVNLGCYVFLFLSLMFSSQIAEWISYIDLNCISLWSLTLLYFTLELKAEIREKIYLHIMIKAGKKVEKQKASLEEKK